jgi:basic membrane protein A and related proteins
LAGCLVLVLVSTLLLACAAPSPAAPAAPTSAPAQAQPTAAAPAQAQPTAAAPAQAQPTAASTAKAFKACWMYGGPVGDQGWVYAQDQGRKLVEKTLPGVEAVFVESVPYGADAERVIGQLADDGCKLIITNSFSFLPSIENVKAKYPNVMFETYEGFETAPNHSIHKVQAEQAAYIAGILAGKMTKSNIIGGVVAFPNSDVLRHINAMTLGARSVNPDAKVRLVWINKWYDPVKEKEAADGLIAMGADVLFHNQASAATLQAAEAKGVYSIGYTDQDKFAPQFHLTSEAINWGAIYLNRVKAAMDGTWKPEKRLWKWSDDAVFTTPYGPKVPDDVKKVADAKKEELKAGTVDIWKGPIKDNEGKVRVPEGGTIAEQDLGKFDWLIEGVEGTIPKTK